MIGAGELRHVLKFMTAPTDTDAMGQPVAEWPESFTQRGSVEDLKGKRLYAAMQVHAEITTEVKTRYNSSITDGMRIKHGTRTLEIIGIPADPDGKRRYLVCTCREVR